MTDIVQEDHRPFASLLPPRSVVGDAADGIILLQEPKNARDAGLGCVEGAAAQRRGHRRRRACSRWRRCSRGCFAAWFRARRSKCSCTWAYRQGGALVGLPQGRPDLYSLTEFQEASLKEGLAHADGAKRWRWRDTTTLMTARLSAPIPDLRRQQRASPSSGLSRSCCGS